MIEREVVGGKGEKGRMGIKRSEYQRWVFLGGTLMACDFFAKAGTMENEAQGLR